MTATNRTTHRVTSGAVVVIVIAVALGAGVFLLAHDLIIGLAAGAGFYAVAARLARASGRDGRHLSHH